VSLDRPEDPHRVAFLELFFDLVYVFALFQLSHTLREHLTWRGALHTLVLLLALWWVWNLTSGATDRFDPRHATIQRLVIACMFGCFVMAAAVPGAFGPRGPVFAGTYVTVQVGRALTLAVITRADGRHHPALRLLFWLGLSAMPWLAGAAAHGWGRAVLWALAVAVDYTGLGLRVPTPGLGRARWTEFAIEGEYLAERHRLFFIIALGELILTSGLAYSHSGATLDRIVPAAVAFGTTVLLWRVYIYRAGEVLGTAITAAPDPYHIGVLATYAQPLVVAGIVSISAADELLVQDPFGHARAAWTAAMLGGTALFLAGRAGYEYAVYARVSVARLVGVVVLGASAPAMTLAPRLFVASVATTALAGIAWTDTARGRRTPVDPPSPPAPRRP
jgi:low temperature requirement protein LtrA